MATKATRTGGLALLLWTACCGPAAAQFYTLEGRFACLNDPQAVCFDWASDWPAPARPEAAAVVAAPATPRRALPVPPPAPPQRPALGYSLSEIALRLQAGTAAPLDIPSLRAGARDGDARALELLAWCHLKGVGVAADAVQAYLLYSAAAAGGVANAQRNQAIVYETDMTPEQRHQALIIENDVLLAPPSSRR